MGGYGSGRKRAQPLTHHCIQLDMSTFKRHMQRPGHYEGCLRVISGEALKHMRPDEKPGLYFRIDIYEDERQQDAAGARWPVYGRLSLIYQARIGDELERHIDMWLPLVTTPCHYGGVRWWMIAPCCGQRSRVLYLANSLTPECRACAHLHYASQMATPEERGRTYERYLLANWGYAWAVDRYYSLKHHYLPITPELEELRQRSALERDIHLLKKFIAFERSHLQRQVRAYLSLSSEEARRQFLEHLTRREQEELSSGLVCNLATAFGLERSLLARNPGGETSQAEALTHALQRYQDQDEHTPFDERVERKIHVLEAAHDAMVAALDELKAAA